jgi:hypothetical protein
MSGEQSIWAFVNQYVTQIVFMIGIIFAAAKWINKKNIEQVSGLRYELIGDSDHDGIIQRMENNFNNNLQGLKSEFTMALDYAKDRQKTLADEVNRLRKLEDMERFGRRGQTRSYDEQGEQES